MFFVCPHTVIGYRILGPSSFPFKTVISVYSDSCVADIKIHNYEVYINQPLFCSCFHLGCILYIWIVSMLPAKSQEFYFVFINFTQDWWIILVSRLLFLLFKNIFFCYSFNYFWPIFSTFLWSIAFLHMFMMIYSHILSHVYKPTHIFS